MEPDISKQDRKRLEHIASRGDDVAFLAEIQLVIIRTLEKEAEYQREQSELTS